MDAKKLEELMTKVLNKDFISKGALNSLPKDIVDLYKKYRLMERNFILSGNCIYANYLKDNGTKRTIEISPEEKEFKFIREGREPIVYPLDRLDKFLDLFVKAYGKMLD